MTLEGRKSAALLPCLDVLEKYDDPIFDSFLQIYNTKDSSKQKPFKSGSK